MIHKAFPGDPIVGEEDAKELRVDSGKEMRDRIVELANEAITKELGVGDVREWGIGPGQELTTEELLDSIDRGNFEGGPSGSAPRVQLSCKSQLTSRKECGRLIPLMERKAFFVVNNTPYVYL